MVAFALLSFGLLVALVVWLVEPALAYVDPTAAGHAVQSLYVATMSAVLAAVAFPRRISGLVTRLRSALSRRGGHRGPEHH